MQEIIAQFTTFNFDMLLRLLVPLVLAGLIGFQREHAGKPAGIRTYGLVALGAALFTYLSIFAFTPVPGTGFNDPARVAAQGVVGIGFLGAGLIVFRESRVEGLTTAAGLWVSAAIGMASGAGMHAVAVVTAVLALVLLALMRKFDFRPKVSSDLSRANLYRAKSREIERPKDKEIIENHGR